MFDNHELIRIYYALKADTARREASEYADQMTSEIARNKAIMATCKSHAEIVDNQFEAPKAQKPFDLWDVLKQHGVRIGEGGDLPKDLYERAYNHAQWSSYVTLPDGKPYLITAIQMEPING